jgi:hypothetical protein
MTDTPTALPPPTTGTTVHVPRARKHEAHVVTYRGMAFTVTRKLSKAEKKAAKRSRRQEKSDD